MDDEEFEVLDELYFVISYAELADRLDLSEEKLKNILIRLSSKEWIRIYEGPDRELDAFDLDSNFRSYHYLASKKGLMAHNRQ